MNETLRGRHFRTGDWTLGGFVVVVIVASASLAAAALPASTTLQVGRLTNIESDAVRMISYRHQQHMWQTADGVTHLLVNRGSYSPGASLAMYSSANAGLNWRLGPSLSASDAEATADGDLSDDELWVTYSTASGAIEFAVFDYDAQSGWTLANTETVVDSPSGAGINPAIAVDADGGAWCAFVLEAITSNYSIRMFYRDPSAQAWQDTGFVFGPIDNESIERSARPVRIPGGMGMLYTVRDDLFWAYRMDDWDIDEPWVDELLYASSGTQGSGPYASHFSVAPDSQGNLHLVTLENGGLDYFKYSSTLQEWSTVKKSAPMGAVYVQASVTRGTDTISIYANNAANNLSVLQSHDGGGSFITTDLLTHIVKPMGIYEFPRMETPTVTSSAVPVVQQVVENGVQKLLRFSVNAL